MFRWEWLVIELLVLGWAVFELVRTRRGLRRLREAQRKQQDRSQP